MAGLLITTVSAAIAQMPCGPQPCSLPPGAIGGLQLAPGGTLPGYFQPVEIRAPEGASISLAEAGSLGQPQPAPAKVGLLLNVAYRICVFNIPLRSGEEVFPTIQVVNRLHAPAGQEARFPIHIELTQEDLELALAGKFVTRVIYLEDPEKALPIDQGAGRQQSWFDVGPGQNATEVAWSLGRPVAIVRMGGRVPDRSQGPDAAFLMGSPPLVKYPAAQPIPRTVAPDNHADSTMTPAVAASTPCRTPVIPDGLKRRLKILPPPPGKGSPATITATASRSEGDLR